MCLPQECSKRDIEIVINDTNFVLSVLSGGQIGLSMNTLLTDCQAEKSPPFNAGAIIMIVISCLFALMAVLGTAADWLLSKMKEVQTEQEIGVNSDVEKTAVSERTHLLGESDVIKKKKKSQRSSFMTLSLRSRFTKRFPQFSPQNSHLQPSRASTEFVSSACSGSYSATPTSGLFST